MEPKMIQMAALGRALHPGTLYDCRNDSFIPGITLWDNELIKKSLDSRRQPKTDLNFSASDSLNEKAKLLDVSASLKASFLGGLVEVGGAAKYLRDNKTSARQSRASLQFSQTTKFEQLTMDQLGSITYPKVFEAGTATHVVTAVLYGGQAFMVFDLIADENEDTEEIEGNLSVLVQNMPSFSIEGAGAVTMSESDKKLASTIKCTFYGDYELEENPTTYMEAIQLYRKLPSLLRKRQDDAVPIKVWLYPLARLGDKAATLQREIHKTLISKADGLLEELGNAETLCNDLITNTAIKDFHEVTRKLKTFQKLLENYKVMFLKVLRRLIPAIRGGTEQEKALADIITIHEESPFRSEKLNQWLEKNQGEVNLLTLYTQQLTGVPVVKYSALLSSIIIDPNVDTVVCFCFTSLEDVDPYLSTVTTFLKAHEFENLTAIPESADQDIQVWFHKPELIKNLKENFSIFKGFSQANKDEAKIRCVVVSVSDSSNPGATIQLYRKGKMVEGAFKPVSKPPAPKVEVQDNNIVLTLQKPYTGSTLRFRVEYRIIQATDLEADTEKWEVRETPDAQETFTLTGLQLTKQYNIQYRAISDVGVSEASDSVLFFPKGKLKFAVGPNWSWSNNPFITKLRHKVMSSLGTSQWSRSTIQPMVKTLAKNLEIPYLTGIRKGLITGIAFHYEGVVPADSKGFKLMFKTGKGEDDDVGFCLHLWPEITAFQRTCINGTWVRVGRVAGCPLLQGSEFDIYIAIGEENYMVYLNGWRYCTMNHVIPVTNLAAVSIEGDVVINSLGFVPNWSTSAFGKDQSSGMSRWELCKVQPDGVQPLCKPNQPYLGQISGGLKCGLALFFQGVIPSDFSGFEINYKTGPNEGDDVVFQFKVEPQAVVCNTYKNGKWEDPESTEETLFAKGEGFDIIMIIRPAAYQVTVNGRDFCTFVFTIPVEKVSTLQIRGDVLMNTAAIIHVDRFNLTLDLSAHI